ncbi:MAG: hypothetical protein OEY97_05020 [Nitrospirota bacterium]|nr:hypothetical protein [Nitrospirota bacterium]
MDNASLSDADRDVIAGILANYTRMAENYVTEYHAQNYRDRIAEGKKVIVVAHSQGNLFANRAGSLLTAEELESFSIVGVANVDNRVLKGSYVTLDIDWAVALARYRFPDTLPPNLTDPPSADDPFNHKFVGTYMRSGTNAQTAIKGLVPVLYDALLTPAQKQKDGIITVQLSWGNPTDMDLHVFEPGGWHVYWSSPQGMSGKLDVDRWSYGPEHYYVACDAVAVGRYRIGVNYYDDNNTSGPSSYWINVKAGDTEQRIPLAGYSSQLRAQFTAGDYSPQMEGYIDVTGSAEEGYQFEVGSF